MPCLKTNKQIEKAGKMTHWVKYLLPNGMIWIRTQDPWTGRRKPLLKKSSDLHMWSPTPSNNEKGTVPCKVRKGVRVERATSVICFSLRAIYGTDELRNALHGSKDFAASEREIRFMFPEGEFLTPAFLTPPPNCSLLKVCFYLEDVSEKKEFSSKYTLFYFLVVSHLNLKLEGPGM